MELDEKLTFGKHKWKTVAEVIDRHPSYALWAHKNVSFFSLSPSNIQKCIAATDTYGLPRGGPDDEDWDTMDNFDRDALADSESNWSDFGNN